MLPFAEAIVGGTAAGLIIERCKRFADHIIKSNEANRDESEIDLLRKIAHLLALSTRVQLDPDTTSNAAIEKVVELRPDPAWRTISREGRAHLMLFVPAAFTIRVQVPGLAPSEHPLFLGWNILDLPDGTQYALQSTATTNITVLARKDDEAIGAAI